MELRTLEAEIMKTQQRPKKYFKMKPVQEAELIRILRATSTCDDEGNETFVAAIQAARSQLTFLEGVNDSVLATRMKKLLKRIQNE